MAIVRNNHTGAYNHFDPEKGFVAIPPFVVDPVARTTAPKNEVEIKDAEKDKNILELVKVGALTILTAQEPTPSGVADKKVK